MVILFANFICLCGGGVISLRHLAVALQDALCLL
jgi:hypothetical protein